MKRSVFCLASRCLCLTAELLQADDPDSVATSDCFQVTDRGLAHLRGLNALTSLTLIQTNIGDGGLLHLEELPDLKSLTRWENRSS